MTHIAITINNKTIFNGDLNQWTTEPPEHLKPYLHPASNPQPWMRHLGLLIVDTLITNTPTTINIHTEPTGWTLQTSSPPSMR